MTMEEQSAPTERTRKLEKALREANWSQLALIFGIVEAALGAGLIMRGGELLYWGVGTAIAGALNTIIYCVWRVRTTAFVNRAGEEIALELETKASDKATR